MYRIKVKHTYIRYPTVYSYIWDKYQLFRQHPNHNIEFLTKLRIELICG